MSPFKRPTEEQCWAEFWEVMIPMLADRWQEGRPPEDVAGKQRRRSRGDIETFLDVGRNATPP